MTIDPQHINDGISSVTVLLTAAGGTVAGGGIVGVMAKIIWAQFERRLNVIEGKTVKLEEKMELVVKKEDCRHDRSSCAANLGRSIDEVKEIVKEIHKEIYVFRNGNGTGNEK